MASPPGALCPEEPHMSMILRFTDPDATTHARVGGKGANLARLAQAGFRVPPGFSITTDAYVAFLRETDIVGRLDALVGRLEFGDLGKLEAQTAEIRELIESTEIPADLAETIGREYAEIGTDVYVAVRSSGTAEDLAEASFAGQHDTYLDIRGHDGVLDAVRRCWASMWTARAVAYRNKNGFPQLEGQIAVVVQTMVSSEVSGVMFTGNPLTAATDEIVIDASWGLGEAVVSGIVTPDQFIVKSWNLELVQSTINTKEEQIVRNPETGVGAIEQSVPANLQDTPCLTDAQVAEVAELGKRVQAYYDEMPQDLEWGLADGTVYLLQSRPVTGVEFTWDADVEEPCWTTRISLYMRRRESEWISDNYDDVWTHEFGNAVWTGVMAPLSYSARFPMYSDEPWAVAAETVGADECREIRLFKYHRGTAYYNTRWYRIYAQKAIPQFRPGYLAETDPLDKDAILAAPFDWMGYARQLLRVTVAEPMKGPWGQVKWLYSEWRSENGRLLELATISEADARTLTDQQLITKAEGYLKHDLEYNRYFGGALLVYMRDAMSLLGYMVTKWYSGSNTNAIGELLAGSNRQTDTLKENHALWAFAETIRHDSALLKAFREHRDGEFFAALEGFESGRAFLAEYQPWALEYEHRGHADRDMYYPRRTEDLGIDYRNFEIFLNVENSVDPSKAERAANERREKTYAEVLDNIKRGGQLGVGYAKAAVFEKIYHLTHDLMMARDDERQCPTDRMTMGYKRCFMEMAARLVVRGVLNHPDEVHALAKHELYDVLLERRGPDTNPTLLRAKIDARMKDILRAVDGEAEYPFYLQHNRAVDRSTDEDSGGGLRGTGNSPGIVTGTARVVRKLTEAGRVREGEIMITHHTDPGWTPVFLLLSGVITETGGLMSHASSVAREYGFPAIQMKSAMSLIPDGATITVNGNTGEVTVHEDDADADSGDLEAAPEPAAVVN